MPKFPKFSQWKQIFKVLKKGEKITLLFLFVLAFGSLIFLATDFYIKNTKVVPATGGSYIEGAVGQPRFINPIYGETNDIDRTLIDLVFSGLMSYDKDGKIVKDLADDYKISSDGKTYDFTLKDNTFWQDGKPLTADDVIFTIKTIQNSDYKSPLRANWIDVNMEKTSDKSLTFRLKSPYNSFLENSAVKIMPKHIWENILPESFALSSYNLQPIGSGPYSFKNLKQTETGFIKNIDLAANRKYYNKTPFISGISFQFFEKKEDLIKAANSKEIDGFSLSALDNSEVKDEKFSVYYLSLPRYFAVFFNTQKTKLFSDINLRKALNYAIDKNKIISEITSAAKDKALIVDSPILPEYFGYQEPKITYEFSEQTANNLLDKTGFKNNSYGQREKTLDKKPAFQFKNYLSMKSKGKDVTELQACLARLPNDNFSSFLQGETNGTYGKGTENAITEFQKKYLPDENPTGEVGKMTRTKLNELCITPQETSQLLQFAIITINQPQLVEVANLIKDYWQKVGVTVNVTAVEISELKSIIKERNYDAFLYGEALGTEPDLYPFWHSSQKNDPGLNLSEYENKDIDILLKEARESLDNGEKQAKYEKLQDIIIEDAPALFLYNPDYIYWISAKINGFQTTKIADPAKRFSNVANWYIKTRRVWK
ncbi:MAG: peptide ABC transporter substrate-binding protein [Candidatus Staskawiczbacteria bacterium]|nr:peptide ABC transporter substrate-binding protein [Candidatus Staskawiczbacteria bacterium]